MEGAKQGWTDEVKVMEITLPINPCKKTHSNRPFVLGF